MANQRRTSPHPEMSAARVRELFYYDPETGVLTWRVAPFCHAERLGKAAGSANSSGYVVVRVDGKTHQAHRLIWLHVTGRWPEGDIDHRDRCRINNSWENLRECSREENMQNCSIRSNNSSGCPGVGRKKGRWYARLGLSGRRMHLGYFDTFEEAKAAYSLAKRRHHNFQPEHAYVVGTSPTEL